MRYRTLGKTGLRVSAVGIETHRWSGMGGRLFTVSDIRSIVERAHELGINFIDTGECYFFHASERLIGEALSTDRQKFIIATKFGHVSEPSTIRPAWTAEEVRKQLDDSLRSLKTDYIDLYQMHINSDADVGHLSREGDGIAKCIGEAKRAGTIRHLGICLGDDRLLDEKAEILSWALRHFPIETVQFVHNLLDRKAGENVCPIASQNGLGVITRVPLAKGYLSSRFKPDNRDYDPARMAEVETIKKELPANTDLAEWAIGWCLKNPAVSTVIPGCSAPAELDSTVNSLSFAE